ncbi:MAG: hypothetical protein WCJ26_04250 [bacterium]
MRNSRHIATNDVVGNRMEMSNHQVKVPLSKLSSGSVDDKFPILLDDGRTVVYITDRSREREIRLRYGLQKG